MEATSLQRTIANDFMIPISQAHLISIEKHTAYLKWKRSPEQVVESLLDEICMKQMISLKKEWMNCERFF